MDTLVLHMRTCDGSIPLATRMRSLWKLRDDGTDEALEALMLGLADDSALLRHEICYVLGQLRKAKAIPVLVNLLEVDRDVMVRHEAAEALGAIADPALLDKEQFDHVLLVLKKFVLDAAPEVSETCQVAIDGIQWRIENAENREPLLENAEFSSVDPAPPASKKEKSVEQLRDLLLNPDKPTFKRYRALFSLRNINTAEAVLAVCDALNTGSDLFRHEVAFVLGQMEHPASVPALVKALQDTSQHAMVRHEAAEALGSIASPEVMQLLQQFRADSVVAVRESCDVACSMNEYWQKFNAGLHPD